MKAIRDPHQFGNHEANATIRYVEVYEILPDPQESDDFPIPYQPVQVKKLRFEGYVAAATEVMETDNADVSMRCRKGGKRHGTIGNGITVMFEIDGGITPPCECDYDETADTLTVKVKASTTTWQQVAEAVAGVLSGAFILEASNPSAEVGAAIESESGTTSGGMDGAYETYGNAFGVGDHETKDDAETGDRFWIIWRADPQRWEILTGDGNHTQQFALIVEKLSDGDPDLEGRYIPGSPAYETDFEIANFPSVLAVLLNLPDESDARIPVDETSGLTFDQLKFQAYDLRIEGVPKVGDVVRVWSSDGVPVLPGENWNFDESEIEASDHFIYCDVLNCTDHLRSLPTWDLAEDQVLVHAADTKALEWMEAEAFVAGPGGVTGGGSGDTVVAGYAIDTSGTGTVTVGFDPTEITGFVATEYQFLFHDDTATAGTATDPKWVTPTGFDDSKTQLLGHINGTLHAKTIAEWLALLTGHTLGADEIIGHVNGGAVEWKELTSKVINNPTDIDLTLDSDSLDSVLDYTPVTILVWPAASDGTPATFTDSVSATPCASS
jgi:hypothetical protein